MNLFFTMKKIMETVQFITAIPGKETGIEGIQAEIEDQITPHHKEEEVMGSTQSYRQRRKHNKM